MRQITAGGRVTVRGGGHGVGVSNDRPAHPDDRSRDRETTTWTPLANPARTRRK